MAENLVPGSTVGPLFQTIMVNQFTRLRDGDRFFYLNEQFSPSEEAILRQGNTLAKVIEANTGITNLPSDVFVFNASISGMVSLATGGSHPGLPPGDGRHHRRTGGRQGRCRRHDHDEQPGPLPASTNSAARQPTR